MNTPLLPTDDQPLRLKEVAKWLGISVKTLRRRIDFGEIEAAKMGGLWIVAQRNLKGYLEKINKSGGHHE